MSVIAAVDRCVEKGIRLIGGYSCVKQTSHWIDTLAHRITEGIDACLLGKSDYEEVLSEEDGATVPRASVRRARLFRRKYCIPRRRLVRRGDDSHWERLLPGESTGGSRTYHECDVPLSSLTEFGDGWVLYFWTIKIVGLLALVSLVLVLPAWIDMSVSSREVEPTDVGIYGGKVLSFLLSWLVSAECDDYERVCINKECTHIGFKHRCSDPRPIYAIACLAVMVVYTIFIVSLRTAFSETDAYVKRLAGVDDLRTEDYSIMVENPPKDAVNADEWRAFFSQFGQIAYVTVAKNDGELVWKTLEPRQLLLMLYRDNPQALAKHITVVEEEEKPAVHRRRPDPRRASVFVGPRDVGDGGSISSPRSSTYGQNRSFLDGGDKDADGGPEDSLVRMAPWYTGGHLKRRRT